MKGFYGIFIKLKSDRYIKFGVGKGAHFRKGFYLYVGSAMGGIGRINRYIGVKKKKKHWHIDYFLEFGVVKMIIFIPSEKRREEEIAKKMATKFNYIKGFGSTDTSADSHLFYSPLLDSLLEEFLAFL